MFNEGLEMSKRASFTVSNGDLVLQLEPAEEGGYIVTSPFEPELITEADSLEEAFERGVVFSQQPMTTGAWRIAFRAAISG